MNTDDDDDDIISLKTRVILWKREFLGCETERERAKKPQSRVLKKIACIAAFDLVQKFTFQ